MSEAGQLRVSARLADGQLADIQVQLSRPPVPRLFVGQLPAVVVKTVPYLYALCADAQRAVAALALATAGGDALPAAPSRALWIECLHEHLWRLLLDWPLALGAAPEREVYAAWRALRHTAKLMQETRYLLANVLAPLSEKCLRTWVDRSDDDTRVASLMLDPAGWRLAWREARRVLPNAPLSVAAAYRQRLHAAQQVVVALETDLPYPLQAAGGDGEAVAQALTARGILTHAVRVQDGRVSAYQVEAPTDAYFADSAALCSLLAGQPVADEASARLCLTQAVLALDPCVPFTVELLNA
ncbi:MAG: hypothetical protein L6Q40_00810 [Azonexus sp.]|nr:hypothetical protein [Azonexus sp.]